VLYGETVRQLTMRAEYVEQRHVRESASNGWRV
jgi:hypothetical protein